MDGSSIIMDRSMITPWYCYLLQLLAGALVTNGIPHFVNGISGKRFPSPFSGGPGTEDAPTRNVLWGAGNIIVGGALLWTIREGLEDLILVIELVVVSLAWALFLARIFTQPASSERQ